ncbi:MAG: MBL fold metallo-hydrolase [Thaumarchaeota archaeon]|nr:MBL fold metallo-hydrolase [Candidatus Calditenuaceae archaeon]MDW8186757.1 MBL fold metallo-hydrolase [Nitrososphaerota archaeon]
MPSSVVFGDLTITWLRHDGFLLTGAGKTVVIDPFNVRMRRQVKADVVFVTHDHFDHCSLKDLEPFVDREKTSIVAARNCSRALKDLGCRSKEFVEPGSSGEVSGVRYQAVPAYNVNKFRAPGVPFHPKNYGGVGYVIEIAGVRVYHAGDTDDVPELAQLKAIDVALLPVSGTYVMTAEEAADFARKIAPKLAIPMHFGEIVGSIEDAERFRSLAGLRVEILRPEV